MDDFPHEIFTARCLLNSKPRPASLVRRRFALEQIAVRCQGIHGQYTFAQHCKSVWCIDRTRANADTGSWNKEAVNAVACATQRLARMTEVRLVPEMHPRLVRCFNLHSQVGQRIINTCLHIPFGRLAQIVGIEVKQIIVFDIRFWCTAGLQIPDRLEEAPRDQPRIRERQGIPAIEDNAIAVVGQDSGEKMVLHHN
ncbi:hypothetical protein CFU_0918 [Collimonas fungivorans Ter331]|uniref:Uncharacterized protein n=1 Tax=Collimonas fungivorans (strain Ter331) TaxID=1005048 RepID=G0AIG7_COLFT|nr:hypothetical protein CFU_0918 [Collimonas fungivorans Ter331]